MTAAVGPAGGGVDDPEETVGVVVAPVKLRYEFPAVVQLVQQVQLVVVSFVFFP